MSTAAAPTKNCASCAHWLCRIRATGVGQCRAKPPPTSFNWPRTREDQVCGEWKHTDTLAKEVTPGAPAAVETREPAAPAEALKAASPDASKDVPAAKPAAGSPAGGPTSLLQKATNALRGRGGR